MSSCFSSMCFFSFLWLGASASYAGTATYRDVILGDGPIVYYEFDEASGSTAVNSATTGSTYTGAINTGGGSISVGQSSFAQGGTAYDFGGGVVEAASALTTSLSAWTLEAWVNYDSAKASASNFLSNDQGGWNDDVLFGIGAESGGVGVPGGNVGVIHQDDATQTRDSVTFPLVADQWNHVVVTGENNTGAGTSTLRLYLNGVLVDADSSVSGGVTFNGIGGEGSPILVVGAARASSFDAGYRPYDGLLDEVAIYDSVLDAATISAHYAASGETAPNPPDPPGPVDLSGFGLDVIEYAPGPGESAVFQWATHIAFGPNGQEIISDLRNDRLLYRDSPDAPLLVSPIPLDGHHSVVYNPSDQLYYVNDTDNNRLMSFADLSSATITAQTSRILGVNLSRPHDIVIDPETNWLYAINPNSGHVFRFTAIGENESVLSLGGSLGGYARSLTFANGRLYAMGSAAGRIIEVVDWDTAEINVYQSFGKIRGASAGSWTTTGLVINDAEFFQGHWYVSSYFGPTFSGSADPNENKLIRFATFDEFENGNWEDLSGLIPDDLTPYYFTPYGESLYLAVFDHASPGAGGDAVFQFTPSLPFKIIVFDLDEEEMKTTLTWNSKPGELFEIQKSFDLDDWAEVGLPISASPSPSRTTTAVIESGANEPRVFYRIARISNND